MKDPDREGEQAGENARAGAAAQPGEASDADPLGSEALDTPDGTAGEVEEQLDGLRIRQLSALRRSGFRARSHVLIGAGACAFTGVLLVLIAAAHVRVRGWGWLPLVYAGVSCAAVLLTIHFGRRAAGLSRELRTPTPLPPAPPGGPDFSTLSDGSQHWKNLEDIR